LIDEPPRFLSDVGIARDGRRVIVSPPFLAITDRAFRGEPWKHGLDRGQRPVPLLADPLRHFGSSERSARRPQRLHDLELGFADPPVQPATPFDYRC